MYIFPSLTVMISKCFIFFLMLSYGERKRLANYEYLHTLLSFLFLVIIKGLRLDRSRNSFRATTFSADKCNVL